MEDKIKNKIEKLTNEQVEKIGKKEKTHHLLWMYVSFCILIISFLSAIGLMVLNFIMKPHIAVTIFLYVFIIFFIAAGIFFIIHMNKERRIIKSKKDIIQWTYYKIEQDIIKQEKIDKEQERLRLESKQINGKNIKTVTMIDSYTEVRDKLHAFLNWQEIIQVRIYKFNVFFDDLSSGVYTAEENSPLYNKLIKFINSMEKDSNSNITKQIKEFKDLLDQNIITLEEFENKKKELLNK